jgi:hypothetical protein
MEPRKSVEELVSTGREMPPLGTNHPVRPYFCRECGREERGTHVPDGWYSLSRHMADAWRDMRRLGIYCSAACLEANMPRIIGTERNMARDGQWE